MQNNTTTKHLTNKIMTPKLKARELRDKMYLKIPSVYDPTMLPHYPIAKEMALIAVNEILELRKGYFDCTNPMQDESFWKEVKQEICDL